MDHHDIVSLGATGKQTVGDRILALLATAYDPGDLGQTITGHDLLPAAIGFIGRDNKKNLIDQGMILEDFESTDHNRTAAEVEKLLSHSGTETSTATGGGDQGDNAHGFKKLPPGDDPGGERTA